MARRRYKPEEKVSMLRQAEVLHGQGMSMADAIRQLGISEVTYCRWRKEYGGMSGDQGQVRDVLDDWAGCAGAEAFVPRPFWASYLSVELLSDGAHLTALELADPDGPPALGGADHGAEHELEHGLLAKGVGDDLEPPALLDE